MNPNGSTSPAPCLEIADDVNPKSDSRCSCWFGPVVLHSGHCCFRDDQVGPVFCHRVSIEAFPDAPAGDMPATLNSELIVDGQLALLSTPTPHVRSFLPVPAQDSARTIETRYALAGFL